MNTGPKKTVFTQDELQELRRRAIAEIEALGISKSAAAKDADIAGSTFSEFLAGNYKGDNNSQARKISDWLQTLADREEADEMLASSPDFQATRTAEEIHATFLFAHHGGRMVAIAGGPGVGKTTTARWYAENKRNVWIATADPASKRATGILSEITEATGFAPSGRSLNLRREITNHMHGRKGLLIIDEAQHLDIDGLEQVRSIHDRCGVGVVLMGNQSIYARVGGPSRKAEFAQIHSRIAKVLQRAKPYSADVEMMAEAWGVETPAELKFLKIIAAKPGALRGVDNCLGLATIVAREAGEKRSLKHLKAAWADSATDAPIVAEA